MQNIVKYMNLSPLVPTFTPLSHGDILDEHLDMSGPSGKFPFDCQKNAKNLTFFPEKLPKIFIFFKKIAVDNFFEKMKILGNFFVKLAIFRRVSSLPTDLH